MLKVLVLVSGWIEVLFGVSAMLAPALVVAGVGGTEAGAVTLTLVRLLGAATFGVGIGALAGRNHIEAKSTRASPSGLSGLGSYELGGCGVLALVVYNVLAAPVLIFGALAVGSAGLWGAAVLHTVVGLLFLIAIFGRR